MIHTSTSSGANAWAKWQTSQFAGIFVLLLTLFSSNSPANHAPKALDGKEIVIGVLAFRGPEQALTIWQPTVDYLAEHITPGPIQTLTARPQADGAGGKGAIGGLYPDQPR